MTITTDQIKALREQTGVGILDCRNALEDANGQPSAQTGKPPKAPSNYIPTVTDGLESW